MRTRALIFLGLIASALFADQRTPQTIDIRFKGTPAGPVSRNHDELRVLFVGNSLTYFNEMPWLTEQIAESLESKPRLKAVFVGRSGATLANHWREGKAIRAIREGAYAYVVLQPQSTEIVRTPDETTRFAALLDEEIKNSGAKTVIFLTWSPRDGQPQALYNERSITLARKLGAVIAPVGVAWSSQLNEGAELFDGSVHPNLAGSYLAACVFYSTFYGRSPVNAIHSFDVRFDIPEFYRRGLEHERIDATTARAIQLAAWRAVSTMSPSPANRRVLPE